MSQQFRIGPGYIMMADSIQAPLEDWSTLGRTRGDIIFNFESGSMAFVRSDQTGVARLARQIGYMGENANIQAPLLDHQTQTLIKANPYATVIESNAKSSIGFSRGTTKLTPKCVAIVPVDDYEALDDWRDSNYCMWLRDAVAHVEGPFTMSFPEGEDALEAAAYEVTFRSLRGNESASATMGYGPLIVAVKGTEMLYNDEQLTFEQETITYKF